MPATTKHKTPPKFKAGATQASGRPFELLQKLIATLQQSIREGQLTEELVEKSTTELAPIRSYDEKKYPKLTKTVVLKGVGGETPGSLAEALLWKLGKWQVYKKFAENYSSDESKATKTDVVLHAFAKHLKQPSEHPLYDQHVIRALWAIASFSEEEAHCIKTLLIGTNDTWKGVAGGGDDPHRCYALYASCVKCIVAKPSGPSMEQLDRLLMPLGQAIKSNTQKTEDFLRLCGKSGTT